MEYTFTLTKVCVCVRTCACILAHIKVKLIFLVNKTSLQKTKITHLASNIKIIFTLFFICIISNPKKLFKDFFVQLFKLCMITKMIQVTHSPKTIGRCLSSRVQSALATAYLSSLMVSTPLTKGLCFKTGHGFEVKIIPEYLSYAAGVEHKEAQVNSSWQEG